MPVIKGERSTRALSADHRKTLLKKLANERRGKSDPAGPVIFEIPLGTSNNQDVLVVWEEFHDLPSEDRSELILEAYKDQKDKISQALGVTYQEATEQYLLPYAVLPLIRKGDADPHEVRQAMLEEGGIQLASDKVDLRFPTMAMAEAAHRRLHDRLPRGYWSIVQTVTPMT